MARRVHPANPWISNPFATRLLLFLCKHKVPFFARAWSILLGCDFYAQLHGEVFMPHPYGIVVGANVSIGKNVVLMEQVTIGGRTLDINDMPVVEDDVYIGAGAKVLGRVRLGQGCTVGANAVVTKDVPPGATVVGANRILPTKKKTVS